MSGVEAYVAELRAALGDRLPPSVTLARLREARAHLLASSAEVGEDEAVRRYGRARPVASGLVRSHRGYSERGAWALALPLAAPLLANGAIVGGLVRLGPAAWTTPVVALSRATTLCLVLAFVARVAQTRRWLAVPMAATHVAAVAILTLLAVLQNGGSVFTRAFASFIALDLAALSAAWLSLNALGFGLGRALDLRRVRRAR